MEIQHSFCQAADSHWPGLPWCIEALDTRSAGIMRYSQVFTQCWRNRFTHFIYTDSAINGGWGTAHRANDCKGAIFQMLQMNLTKPCAGLLYSTKLRGGSRVSAKKTKAFTAFLKTRQKEKCFPKCLSTSVIPATLEEGNRKQEGFRRNVVWVWRNTRRASTVSPSCWS